jgi:hypothetical protein
MGQMAELGWLVFALPETSWRQWDWVLPTPQSLPKASHARWSREPVLPPLAVWLGGALARAGTGCE